VKTNVKTDDREELIKRFAYNFWQIRQRCGLQGTAEQDYKDGEEAYESYHHLHEMIDRRKL